MRASLPDTGMLSSWGHAAMLFFRQRRGPASGISRSNVENLEQEVRMLRARLGRTRGWLAGAVAGVMSLSALVLVVDEKPLKRAIADSFAAFGPGQASAVDAAYAAYERGSYATAMRLSRPPAEQGDARAQTLLGEIYYHAPSALRDDSEAFKWFRRAAEQGDNDAQFHLGEMFSFGRGVPQDYLEAAKWYRMAADQKNAKAQFNLAFLHANGHGVAKGNVLAHMWFNLAAANFTSSESRNRAAMNRDRIAAKMSAQEIAEAQRLAREWKPNESASAAP